MARTYNRRPYSVPMPSSGDVKNHFLTQANWKGVIKNKNFLAVDQESFEDALNVYVDDAYVLKSRPSIKKNDDLPVKDKDIKNVHNFNNGLSMYLEDKLLHIVKNNAIITTVGVNGDYRLLQIRDFVLLFTDDNLRKIDANGNVTNADIYIPKTRLVKLDGSESNLESKNIFTDEEITVYQYNSQASNLSVKNKLIGKNVKIEYDNETFEFEFTENISLILFKNFLTLNKNLLLKKYNGNSYYEYLPFTVSCKNTYAYFDKNTKEIYYSRDGVIFSSVIKIPNNLLFEEDDIHHGTNIELKFCKRNPAILCIMLKSLDRTDFAQGCLYMISVEPDLPTGEFRYPDLTDIALINSYLSLNSLAFDALDYNTFLVEHWTFYDSMGEQSYSCNVQGKINGKTKSYIIQALPTGTEHLYFNTFEMDDEGLIYVMNIDDVQFMDYCNFTKQGQDYAFRTQGYGHYLAPWKLEMISKNEMYLYNGYYTEYFNRNSFSHIDNFLTGPQRILGCKNEFCYGFNQNAKLYKLVDKSDGWNFIEDLMNVKFENSNKIHFIHDYGTNFNYVIENDDNILIRTNSINDVLELEVKNDGVKKYFVPDKISQLTNTYISKNNILQISQQVEDEDDLYFPEITKQTFSSKITNLHPLSETEMGIFLPNEIWRNYLTENGYAYSKSRLDFGCKDGNDIETSFDGKYTLLDTDRGFVALAYQDFIASTEQSATFISDNIQSLYNEFRKDGVNLVKYDNYLLLYNGTESVLVYDFRTGSWWPWKITGLNKLIRNNDELIVVKDNRVSILDYSSIDYYDDVLSKEDIDWNITSQKLHLNANNYDKHIINMTFSSVENDDAKNLFSMNLDVKNYRHFIDKGKEESFDYRIQLIRTLVKRLNYAKVREFQYTLSVDKQNAIKLPLSLSAITIKYKIGGQVR